MERGVLREGLMVILLFICTPWGLQAYPHDRKGTSFSWGPKEIGLSCFTFYERERESMKDRDHFMYPFVKVKSVFSKYYDSLEVT